MAAANSKKPAAVAAAADGAPIAASIAVEVDVQEERVPAWISVQTREGEMWRCGRKWGVEPQIVSGAELGSEAVNRLRSEPRLIVRDVLAPDAA